MPFSIPLSSVSVTQAERDEVLKHLAVGSVSGTGSAIQDLEFLLGTHCHRRNAIALNSGTSALELALETLGIGQGDEVVLPAFTFAAPVSAVLTRGVTPVLCDVDENEWTINLDSCKSVLTSKTRAIIAVDVMGNPCNFDSLLTLGLPLIEDAAEALGSTYRGQPCGSFGEVSIVSLHANKVMTAGEGGIFLTNEDEWANEARARANHGMTSRYHHEFPGHNFRIGNLSAAFAVAQARRLDDLVARRKNIFDDYVAALAGYPLIPQRVQPHASSSRWLACFRTKYRDRLVEHLRAHSVDSRAVWPSLDCQPIMQSSACYLPVSRQLSNECFWLPTYHDLSGLQITYITDVIKGFFDNFDYRKT